jgi:hypothetical protein
VNGLADAEGSPLASLRDAYLKAPGLAKELAVQGCAADATGALQAVEKRVGGNR